MMVDYGSKAAVNENFKKLKQYSTIQIILLPENLTIQSCDSYMICLHK